METKKKLQQFSRILFNGSLTHRSRMHCAYASTKMQKGRGFERKYGKSKHSW